jgi:hypothetical protein
VAGNSPKKGGGKRHDHRIGGRLPNEVSRREKADLQGVLTLRVIETLEALGSLHGYGIAHCGAHRKKILQLNQDVIYPAFLRKEPEGLIASKWPV